MTLGMLNGERGTVEDVPRGWVEDLFKERRWYRVLMG